jgi:histidine-containing phosphotransfer protein
VKEEPGPGNSSDMGKNHEAGSGKEEDAMQLAVAKQQYGEHMDSLRAEGLLDDQFLELQQLQDESSPDFVEEVVLLFIQDSGRIIKNLADSL